MATQPPSSQGPAPGGRQVVGVGNNDAPQAAESAARLARTMSSFVNDLSRLANEFKRSANSIQRDNETIAKETKREREAREKRTKEQQEFTKILQQEVKHLTKTFQEKRKAEAIADAQARRRKAIDDLRTRLEAESTKRLKEMSEKQQSAIEKTTNALRELEAGISKTIASNEKLSEEQQKELKENIERHEKLTEALARMNERAVVINEEKQKELTLTKALSRDKQVLIDRTKDLVAGFTLMNAATVAFTSALRQSQTVEARSTSELMSNFGRQMISGLTAETFDQVQAQTRLLRNDIRSTDGISAQQDAIRAGTAGFFQFTGNRNESAQAAAAIIPSLVSAGIATDQVSAAMSTLPGQFGKLAQMTGRTVTELSALTAELLQEREVREMLHTLNENERLSRIQQLNLDQQKLIADGFSLEQAREIQREQIRARFGTTLRDRVRQNAIVSQNLTMLANTQTDPAERARLIDLDRRRREAQANVNNSRGRTPEEMDRLRTIRDEIDAEVGRVMLEVTRRGMAGSGDFEAIRATFERVDQTTREMSGAIGAAFTTGPGSGVQQGRPGDVAASVITGALGEGSVFGAAVNAFQFGANTLQTAGGALIAAALALMVANGRLPNIFRGGAGGIRGMFPGARGAGGAPPTVGSRTGQPASGIGSTIRPGLFGPSVLTAGIGTGATLLGSHLQDRGHTALGTGTSIAGTAAQYAGLGLMFGPKGALVAGAIGAGVGMYQNRHNLFGGQPSATATTPSVAPVSLQSPTQTQVSTSGQGTAGQQNNRMVSDIAALRESVAQIVAIMLQNQPGTTSASGTTPVVNPQQETVNILRQIHNTLSQDVSTRADVRREVEMELAKAETSARLNSMSVMRSRPQQTR